MIELPDGPEISSAKEGEPILGPPIFTLAGFLKSKTSKAGIVGKLFGDAVLWHRKIVVAVENFLRLAAFDHMHFYGLLKELADVKERGRENARAIGKEG